MRGKLAGGALASAVLLVGAWEGLSLTPYADIVGVKTVCYGETRGIEDRGYSKAECDAMLAQGLQDFDAGLAKCIRRDIPDQMRVALVSWAYNIGTGAACRSTLVRLVNEGRLREACNELPKWNRAGGVVVRGLTNRREAERRLCLSGL